MATRFFEWIAEHKTGEGWLSGNNSMCSFSFFIGIFFNLKTKQLVFLIHWCDDDDDLKVYKWEVNRLKEQDLFIVLDLYYKYLNIDFVYFILYYIMQNI